MLSRKNENASIQSTVLDLEWQISHRTTDLSPLSPILPHGAIIDRYREIYFCGSQKFLKLKVTFFDPLISCSWMQYFH